MNDTALSLVSRRRPARAHARSGGDAARGRGRFASTLSSTVRGLLQQLMPHYGRSRQAAGGAVQWQWHYRNRRFECPHAGMLLGQDLLPEAFSVLRARSLIHVDDYRRVRRELLGQLDAGQRAFNLEFRARNAQDEWTWLQMRGEVARTDADHEPLLLEGTLRDISERVNKEHELRLAAGLMDATTDSVAVLDENFKFLKLNAAFMRLTGYGAADLLQQPVDRLLDEVSHENSFWAEITARVRADGHYAASEVWQRKKNGELLLTRLWVRAIQDQSLGTRHYLYVFSDITRQRQTEQEIELLANHDLLTGLPNRELFLDRLTQAIGRCVANKALLGLIYIDLDNFRTVNDTLGHPIGDTVLRKIAQRLENAVGKHHTVARIAGDAFAVLIEAMEGPDALDSMARNLLDVVEAPIQVLSEELEVTACGGGASFPRDARDAEGVLRNAEIAMRSAKKTGRNTFKRYQYSMNAAPRLQLSLEKSLRHAIDNEEFRLEYQPIYSSLTGGVSGVEALLRWENERFGRVMPGQFMPMAEELGLMGRINEWVIDRACQDARAMEHQGWGRELTVSVNVSTSPQEVAELPRVLESALCSSAIPGARLQLEITETFLLHDTTENKKALRDMRDLGVSVAIDDFGIGYSSLSYLHNFPVDTIKVDQSFVRRLENRVAFAITKSIVVLGRSLDFEVVAEGVETRDQFDAVTSLGCTQVQGFLISHSLKLDNLREFIQRGYRNPVLA